MNSQDIFTRLFEVIEDRKSKTTEKSYVAHLMKGGVETINSKVVEEAAEVCDAALTGDKEHLIYEICDLLFHTFVLAGYKDITIDEIKRELERRFGTSGHDEKTSRST